MNGEWTSEHMATKLRARVLVRLDCSLDPMLGKKTEVSPRVVLAVRENALDDDPAVQHLLD